jgi:hypothetical protein
MAWPTDHVEVFRGWLVHGAAARVVASEHEYANQKDVR